MKKGTKLAALLLGLALVIPACTPAAKSSQAPVEPSSEPQPTSEPAPASESQPAPSSEAPVNYTVTISNKDALQAEWFVGDQSRKVEINIEPKANITQLVNEGKIQITSSDSKILSITGQMASPVAAGDATITVKCGESQDTVRVSLKAKQTVKEKYGVAHEGTAEDPFDNEDACKVAKSDKYNNEDFYVKGVVDRFYYAPGARTDGSVAYYLKAATEGGEQFEVFKVFKDKEQKQPLTDDDIWVGGTATAHGQFTVYQNTQAETTSAIFVSCEGQKPEARKTLEKTFAETLAVGAALADGDSTWDYYKFQGFVTKKDGNNYFLTATKGEQLVSAKYTTSAGKEYDYYSNAIELYSAGKVAELAAKLLEGAKVEVTMLLKNYHGTVENGKDLVDADVTVVEAGTQWAVPEPSVATKTLAEFIAAENTKAKAYYVTATVKYWKDANATEADKYGNLVLTDGENELTVYGATATATALAWDNSSAYAFDNPKDFLTNEVTKAIKLGDQVKMKMIRADYKGAVQGSGVILEVIPAGTPAPATTTIELTDANVLGYAGTNVAYPTDSTPVTATVAGMGIAAVGCGAYGSGIQMRTKNGITSSIYNTTEADINKIELVWAASKDVTAGKEFHLLVDFSNKADFSELVGTQAKVKVDETTKLAEIAPSASAKYFRVTHGNQGAVYLDAIKVIVNNGGETPAPANSYPTFTWADAIQDGSSALDGAKFNKNATYNLKVENVPAAGDYTITLPMMGSDGNGTRTFNTTGTSHDGQGFGISANGVAGKILVEGKTYNEVFGEDQKAWVDVVFAQVTLVEGANTITLTTTGAGYRVSVKADGNITLAPAAVAPEKAAMVWYTEGEGNQAIHFEGAGIWTWVKYGELGYADFNEFNAVKANIVAEYVSDPVATINEIVVSDDNASLKYARVYVVLSAAYNTGVLTLKVPSKDGSKLYEGTLEFAAGALTKVNGVDYAAPVAQPTGAFRGLAKTAAGSFIPVDMVLAADSVALDINGAAITVSSYNWNKKDTLTIVTDGAYGTITATFAENVFTITGLTGEAAAQLDSTYVVKLSGSCQHIDCSVMNIDAINATFLRRYDSGSGWQPNKPADNRMSSATAEGRTGLQCNGFSSGKVGLSLANDFANPIPGTVIKSMGVWIYNPGETAFDIVVYAYKGAGRTSAAQLNTFSVQPGWHFYQTGVVNGGSFTSADSMYNFQLYYNKVAVNPIFDDFCLYM